MSDLLAIGRSGVLAYQGALATIGENVTNADTDGYSRRTVVLKEASSAAGAYSLNRSSAAFGGVQASQVSRVWDQYLAANSWSASSDAGSASTRLQTLTNVQTAIGDSSSGLSAKLTGVFTAANQLAATPTDNALRQTMLSAIGDVATTMRQINTGLSSIAGTVQTQATTVVAQTNTALTSLAKVNIALHTSPQGSAARAQLEDQRDNLLGTLSANVGITASFGADGAVTVNLADYSGPALLKSNDGTPAIVNLSTASDGRLALSLTVQTQTTPANASGGILAGLVDVSATIAGRRQQLDGLANSFATQLNDWQAQGKTPAGTAGAALLTGTTAATIALATGDPDAIAAGSSSATDNGNLLALSSLRGSDGVEATWANLVTAQALAVSTAKTESDAASARKDGADGALDAVNGISLDDEAAQLLRYQQAYSASSKIIQTARQTLQDILSLF